MTKEFTYGIGGPATRALGPSGPAGVRKEPTVYCECGHDHPAKPATATDNGCGRFWLIDLTVP